MQSVNDYMCPEPINDIELKLFRYGRAVVDTRWKGSVSTSVCSRLYYVRKGSFYLVIDGKKVLLDEGGWYLVPEDTFYEFGCDALTEHLYFHLNLSGVVETDVFKGAKGVLTLPDCLGHADEVMDIIDSKKTTDILCIKSIVFKILIKFIEKYNINMEVNSYSPCVIKAVEYIKNNLAETLTISRIAESIFVSESTLTKHFRRELGISVNKYIDELILISSARMITESNLSVHEISELFCFCDQFYFSRKFKAKFGQSPLQYKKSWNV